MTDPLFDVSGRVCVVTGGFGRLGTELSTAFAERGARVAVFDLAERPHAAAADLASRFDAGTVRAYQVDVTDRAALERATDDVEAAWGTPHVLVNAAAIDAPPDAPAAEVGPFERVPEASFDRVMSVNVKGTFLCCQVVGARMAAAGRGSIVTISSIYGMLSPVQDLYAFRRQRGEEFYKPVAYSVSKSALYNLTRYLATYWARQGVRVNTVTLAGVFDDQPGAFLEAYEARMPIGRMADVAEVVGPVIFLASDASSYVTGANLVADGGWSAW